MSVQQIPAAESGGFSTMMKTEDHTVDTIAVFDRMVARGLREASDGPAWRAESSDQIR